SFGLTVPPTPETYTLSLHDALPIYAGRGLDVGVSRRPGRRPVHHLHQRRDGRRGTHPEAAPDRRGNAGHLTFIRDRTTPPPRQRRLFCARLRPPAAGRSGVPRSRNRLSEDSGPGRPRLRLRTRGRRAQLQAGESESLENLTDNLARVRERVRRAAERA